MDVQERIDLLHEVLENWLREDNEHLMVASERTMAGGYFSFDDTKFSLNAIKDRVNKETLERWAENSGLNEKGGKEQNVLCLHAGNLPLVGFQDALATLLSGARYAGKISHKDPFLLPTFLNEVKKTKAFDARDVQWLHRIDDFEGLQNDAILFSGSSRSVPGVKKAIDQYELAHHDTRMLIRTAHFSIAYLDSKKQRHMEDLVEAIFRYGGQGCRSVAIVVSPFELDDIKCELTDYVEQFLMHNPQHLKPGKALKQRYAYNKAIGRPQAWLDDFLIQQGGLELDRDFICYWVPGDEEKAAELAGEYEGEVQSVYVTEDDITIPGWQDRTELLANAQRPHLDWQPDGIDTVEWLIRD